MIALKSQVSSIRHFDNVLADILMKMTKKFKIPSNVMAFFRADIEALIERTMA